MFDCIIVHTVSTAHTLAEAHEPKYKERSLLIGTLRPVSLNADNFFGGDVGYCTININEVILCY